VCESFGLSLYTVRFLAHKYKHNNRKQINTIPPMPPPIMIYAKYLPDQLMSLYKNEYLRNCIDAIESFDNHLVGRTIDLACRSFGIRTKCNGVSGHNRRN
jgi:hypothetical protein